MKYLKFFENYKRCPIGPTNDKFKFERQDEFTNNELITIQELIKHYDGKFKYDNSLSEIIITISKKYVIHELIIYKFIDEWFLIMDTNAKGFSPNPCYYECDQIEGVINCLKKII